MSNPSRRLSSVLSSFKHIYIFHIYAIVFTYLPPSPALPPHSSYFTSLWSLQFSSVLCGFSQQDSIEGNKYLLSTYASGIALGTRNSVKWKMKSCILRKSAFLRRSVEQVNKLITQMSFKKLVLKWRIMCISSLQPWKIKDIIEKSRRKRAKRRWSTASP